MKLLAVLVLLISSQAFAAAKTETIHAFATIGTNDLHCRIDINGTPSTPVEEKTFTALNSPAIFLAEGILEMEHDSFSAKGCEQAKLEQIVEKSFMNFLHIIDMPVEVIKETSESRINGFGQCIATYTETVKINIGIGIGEEIILSSNNGELRPANDCVQ